ncbi:MAG: hypothetical protein WCL14_03185, partial [Bacteroidota bacterium]
MTEQTEIEKRIWIALDRLRTDMNFSSFRSTKILEIIGETKGQAKLDQILNDKELMLLISNIDGFAPPLYIYKFINEITNLVKPNSHLDPWLKPSSPCNIFDFGTSTSFCNLQTEFEAIKSIFQNPKNIITLGDSWQQLDKLNNTFDLITCFPPFGMRKEPTMINGFKTSNDYASSLLIKASMLLNENGRAVFLMSPSFLFNDSNKELINKVGL